MINGHQGGNPNRCYVTTIAQIAGGRMGYGFKSTQADAIVATGLGTGLSGHGSMVKHHTQPGGGVMAHIASRGGHHMGGPFAGGYDIIVAHRTNIGCLAVIERQGGGSPNQIGMASFTQQTG